MTPVGNEVIGLLVDLLAKKMYIEQGYQSTKGLFLCACDLVVKIFWKFLSIFMIDSFFHEALLNVT